MALLNLGLASSFLHLEIHWSYFEMVGEKNVGLTTIN